MAIGDKVKVGIGTVVHMLPEKVPVYDMEKRSDGSFLLDPNGTVYPKVVGAVKGGSLGTIRDGPLSVYRTSLRSNDSSSAIASSGVDRVNVYLVAFDTYQRSAWVSQEHVHIVG